MVFDNRCVGLRSKAGFSMKIYINLIPGADVNKCNEVIDFSVLLHVSA